MHEQLIELTAKGAALLLGLLAAAVLYRLLTGGIRTKGLLLDSEGRSHSPARLQMLVLSIGGAMHYLSLVAQNPAKLPDPPQELLLLVGGSHALFMGSKAVPLFLSILSERLQRK
ncbi:MAG: hypothetical protein JNK48_28490 [Bryobacterales bacterium]|nr:hypothetical protein [Bryobacterales bacterium]